MDKKNKLYLILLIISATLLFSVSIFVGSVNIPFKSIIEILLSDYSQNQSWNIIILETRLPKAIAAISCGIALSISGLQMQTLFKNPLAGPYILGISSGAGLGVAIFIMGLNFLGFSATNNQYGLITFSILGSLMVLAILLSVINRLKDIMTVLILGVMIGSVITAIIGIIQFFSYDAQLKSFIMWTMGDLSAVTNSQLSILTPIVVFGFLLSIALSKPLNTYLLGEKSAISLGLNIKRYRTLVIIVTAVLTGSVTAFCGPIGFIGIVVPHIARMITKTYNHFILIPFSAILGVNIILLADIISQLPGLEKSLPINSVTSLIGIPFIIWIIFRNKRISSLN